MFNIDKSLFIVALLCLNGFFSPHNVVEAPLIVYYLPYCAPFPRLSQSLQGDWLLSWWASELQEEEEEEEACRVHVEAVLLGLRKKDMPFGVDFFWGSSDCCWDFSCWLMMIWMSSWGKVGRKSETINSMSTLPSYHNIIVIDNVSLMLTGRSLLLLIDYTCISFDTNVSINAYLQNDKSGYILYITLTVNKPHEKTKAPNEFILSCAAKLKNWHIVQKQLKNTKDTLLHCCVPSMY